MVRAEDMGRCLCGSMKGSVDLVSGFGSISPIAPVGGHRHLGLELQRNLSLPAVGRPDV